MRLTSEAFGEEDQIPIRYTVDGDDISPPLSWRDAPEGTEEYALIMEDVDSGREQTQVHWVVYGIPAKLKSLPESLPKKEAADKVHGIRQGITSFGNDLVGYGGPAPARGTGPHRYRFRLYALDHPLAVESRPSRDDLLRVMKGHILTTVDLTATYMRAA